MKKELLFIALVVLPGYIAAQLLPAAVLRAICGAAIFLLVIMLIQSYRHGRQ